MSIENNFLASIESIDFNSNGEDENDREARKIAKNIYDNFYSLNQRGTISDDKFNEVMSDLKRTMEDSKTSLYGLRNDFRKQKEEEIFGDYKDLVGLNLGGDIPEKYKGLTYFENGGGTYFFQVMNGGKIGIADKNKTIIISPRFNELSYGGKVHKDGLIIGIEDGKMTLIDSSGKYIINPGDYIISGNGDKNFLGGNYLIENDKDKSGKLVDKDGKTLLEFEKIGESYQSGDINYVIIIIGGKKHKLSLNNGLLLN